MLRSTVVYLIAYSMLIFFWIWNVHQLIGLLNEDGSADAIDRIDVSSQNPTSAESRPFVIPKIIHQTFKNETIPDVWLGAQQSCLDKHPDYEYMLWTDRKARRFIADEYPWFLKTFDGYQYTIQRADAIRYFVLAHYGGIYIDLDEVCSDQALPELTFLRIIANETMRQGCNRRLDRLRAYPAWVRRTVPTGISNNVMGSTPGHPFFVRVTEALRVYDRTWMFPYVTVMYSTGPLFLSVIWRQHMTSRSNHTGRVHILMRDEYNQRDWSFFRHNVGSSWHGWDARLIFWMRDYWVLLVLLGIITWAFVSICSWRVYKRLVFLRSNHSYLGFGLSGFEQSVTGKKTYICRLLTYPVKFQKDEEAARSCELRAY